MSEREKYPLIWWRPFFDISVCYGFIVLAIYLYHISIFFYPLAVFILANRILALSLLSHEAIHGSLFKNYKLNNFIGRWFCAFPTFISFSKYRKLHLLHHRALGNNTYDPDYRLYKDYPQNRYAYILQNMRDVLTLKTIRNFIDYYTEINDVLFSKGSFFDKMKKNKMNGDFLGFIIFYILLFLVLSYFNGFGYYFVFFCVPLFFITQPYVLLMGGLQHGPVQYNSDVLMLSRSVRGPKIFMEIVLPLDINYHSEHHFNAAVPHYWLKKFSRDLEHQKNKIWTSSYTVALKQLFN